MRVFESEDLLSALLAKVPLGIAIVTQEGRYLFANKTYREILDVSENELLTLSVPQCLGIALKPLSLGASVEPQHIQTFSFKGQSQDLQLKQSPFVSASHQILVLHTLQDISESLRLRRMKDTSEKILFHDLRSPVSGVMSLAQLIQMERDVPASILPVVKEIYRRGEKMIVLLENLLDFSKMEEGRLQVFREPLHMKTLLEKMGQRLFPELQRREIQLEFLLNGNPLDQAESVFFWSKESLITGLLENTLVATLHAFPAKTTFRAELSLNSQRLLLQLTVRPQNKVSDPHLFDQIQTPDGKFIPIHYSTRLFLKALEGRIDTDYTGSEPLLLITLPQIPGDNFY